MIRLTKKSGTTQNKIKTINNQNKNGKEKRIFSRNTSLFFDLAPNLS